VCYSFFDASKQPHERQELLTPVKTYKTMRAWSIPDDALRSRQRPIILQFQEVVCIIVVLNLNGHEKTAVPGMKTHIERLRVCVVFTASTLQLHPVSGKKILTPTKPYQKTGLLDV
jgi:hypothetical protein